MKLKLLTAAFISFILFIPVSHAETPKKLKIYMAAGLFNGRENSFNLTMTKKMEERGYATILPMRDGFEGNYFAKAAEKYIPPKEMNQAERQLIYLRDMGTFIPQSDVILANLDDPIDDGVIVEISYAHLYGKPVICYRTDSRSPFNGIDGIGGIHSFVALQCDNLIIKNLPGSGRKKMDKAIIKLAAKIDDIIKSKVSATRKPHLPDYALVNPQISKIVSAANLITGNPKKLHTKSGIKKAVKNLVASKDKLPTVTVTFL